MKQQIIVQLEKVKQASRKMATVKPEIIDNILSDLATLARSEASVILHENKKDLERMDINDPKYDRLLLNENRLDDIANDLIKVADLPSPLSHILEERTLSNKLNIKRVSVPIGVIGIVFESRPNVTFDVFALCLKSGNASVLKGSRDAHFSNVVIFKLIETVLNDYNLGGVSYLAPSEREALQHILNADRYIDTIIPRGGQGLINFVRENALVPVIETGAGIVHTYVDATANPDKARDIVGNAKTRRVSVCNALDTLLIHKEKLSDLVKIIADIGQENELIIYADEPSFEVLSPIYPDHLLHKAKPKDFGTEFLSMKMSIKTVDSLDQALDHIAAYSSKHSEAIVAEDKKTITRFLNEVDAAVVYANTSTAFTDGAQFGLGAEIGISTQKLHARGPMGLRELTSYKWVVEGDGQTRP
ncbi:MAG: glutamate-5-semialdehyde dehydrogenase [Bacteroidota bacterium]